MIKISFLICEKIIFVDLINIFHSHDESHLINILKNIIAIKISDFVDVIAGAAVGAVGGALLLPAIGFTATGIYC